MFAGNDSVDMANNKIETVASSGAAAAEGWDALEWRPVITGGHI